MLDTIIVSDSDSCLAGGLAELQSKWPQNVRNRTAADCADNRHSAFSEARQEDALAIASGNDCCLTTVPLVNIPDSIILLRSCNPSFSAVIAPVTLCASSTSSLPSVGGCEY